LSLQVQKEVLNSFFDRSGELTRGSGFLARFLMCHPESTKGTRFFVESSGMPSMDEFNRRMREILELEVDASPSHGLKLHLVQLSEEAKQSWKRYHDKIESELGRTGSLSDVSDIAAKIA